MVERLYGNRQLGPQREAPITCLPAGDGHGVVAGLRETVAGIAKLLPPRVLQGGPDVGPVAERRPDRGQARRRGDIVPVWFRPLGVLLQDDFIWAGQSDHEGDTENSNTGMA